MMTAAVLQPLVHEWAEYRQLQLLPEVYGRDLIAEGVLSGLYRLQHPAGQQPQNPQQPVQWRSSALAAVAAAAPFSPRRFGAADLSMLLLLLLLRLLLRAKLKRMHKHYCLGSRTDVDADVDSVRCMDG